MKRVVKSLLRQTPYRVVRSGLRNRFQAIEDCLALLKKREFAPRVIVDGGANVGDFALLANKIFPRAEIHMIEPQSACFGILENVAKKQNFKLHKVALGAAAGSVDFVVEPEGVTTGAYVAHGEIGGRVTEKVSVRPLDDLELGLGGPAGALLKLDLQGYELEALKGASRCLQFVDVILSEVSFFAQAYEPPIAVLVAFLDERGFELHDIASVSGRIRDNRAKQGDFVFVRKGCALTADSNWA